MACEHELAPHRRQQDDNQQQLDRQLCDSLGSCKSGDARQATKEKEESKKEEEALTAQTWCHQHVQQRQWSPDTGVLSSSIGHTPLWLDSHA